MSKCTGQYAWDWDLTRDDPYSSACWQWCRPMARTYARVGLGGHTIVTSSLCDEQGFTCFAGKRCRLGFWY